MWNVNPGLISVLQSDSTHKWILVKQNPFVYPADRIEVLAKKKLNPDFVEKLLHFT